MSTRTNLTALFWNHLLEDTVTSWQAGKSHGFTPPETCVSRKTNSSSDSAEDARALSYRCHRGSEPDGLSWETLITQRFAKNSSDLFTRTIAGRAPSRICVTRSCGASNHAVRWLPNATTPRLSYSWPHSMEVHLPRQRNGPVYVGQIEAMAGQPCEPGDVGPSLDAIQDGNVTLDSINQRSPETGRSR